MGTATLIINSAPDREKAAHWASNAPEGTRITFKSSKRTADQNSKLWACLTEISAQVDWYGVKLSPDDWKDVFTAALRRARVVPGLDAGTFVPLGMRTSDMTKDEFSDLLELIAAFAAERGVTLHDDLSRNGAGNAEPPGSETAEDQPTDADTRTPKQKLADYAKDVFRTAAKDGDPAALKKEISETSDVWRPEISAMGEEDQKIAKRIRNNALAIVDENCDLDDAITFTAGQLGIEPAALKGGA